MIQAARELVAVARILADDDLSPGLNGMKNREARKFVNKLLQKHTRGFFDDDGWRPIHKTFKELDRHGIEYFIEKTQYDKNADGNPSSKTWSVEAHFVNDKGRRTTIYIHIVASGAGSVQYPLDRYDVVAYAN
jgi:hypothetical protein